MSVVLDGAPSQRLRCAHENREPGGGNKMHRSNGAPADTRKVSRDKSSGALLSLKLPFQTVLAAAAFACGVIANSETADAVPAFARQTGYYCSTCHTVQPELTPFGRQFKLNGYTSGGTRCGDIRKIFGNTDLSSKEWSGANLAAWVMPSFQHTAKNMPSGTYPPGWSSNDNADPLADASLFYAGQIYCNLGVFSQYSYNHAGANIPGDPQIFLDNTELRYTGKARVSGNDVTWGVLGNNNVTMQDVWNTAPAWAYPWVPTDIMPGPANLTMVEGTFGQRAAGAGAYVWINSMIYAEVSAYRTFDQKLLKMTGSDPKDGTPRADGLMPYWRVALEKTWNQNSFMIGTFGMTANIQPVNGGITDTQLYPGYTDKYTDVGVDAQYQYIGPIHAVTVRASYIWEKQKLDASHYGALALGQPASDRASEDLRSFNISASYIYDRHISFTADYFNVQGSYDANHWGNIGNDGNQITYKPNTDGYSFDLAYVPYPYGGPDLWPWLNARVGVLYTHFNRLDGHTNDLNIAPNMKAKDYDTTFLYAWIDF
jgi:hypothetical protein